DPRPAAPEQPRSPRGRALADQRRTRGVAAAGGRRVRRVPARPDRPAASLGRTDLGRVGRGLGRLGGRADAGAALADLALWHRRAGGRPPAGLVDPDPDARADGPHPARRHRPRSPPAPLRARKRGALYGRRGERDPRPGRGDRRRRPGTDRLAGERPRGPV
ncbi:MAG: transmembrane protein, distant homology with ydbS, partial [uncultured Thermomicrobiales bacterium]